MRYREIQDMLSAWTQVLTEEQHHREGNMSVGFKDTWSRLGEGFHAAGSTCPKEQKGMNVTLAPSGRESWMCWRSKQGREGGIK